jgi:hypothetical protein
MITIFYVVYRYIETLGMLLQSLVEPYCPSVTVEFQGRWSTQTGIAFGRGAMGCATQKGNAKGRWEIGVL